MGHVFKEHFLRGEVEVCFEHTMATLSLAMKRYISGLSVLEAQADGGQNLKPSALSISILYQNHHQEGEKKGILVGCRG